MRGYPVLLRVENRRCVVVGGGQVATHKVTALLDAGAAVTVISPQISPDLQTLADQGRIEIYQMAYQPDQLAAIQPFMVIAATDQAAVNQHVAADAERLKMLVNVTDAPAQSHFTNMATIQRGPMVVGVASGGTAAALSAYLKAQIEQLVGPEIEILAGWMGEARPNVRTSGLNQSERAALWQKILASPILDLLRRGDIDGAKRLFDGILNNHLNI